MTETSGNRSGRSLKYTAFGDVQEISECVDGETFTTSFEYDNLGRQWVVRYPAVNKQRFAVEYHYTELGFLQYMSDLKGSYLWAAAEMNARGQVTREITQSNVETVWHRNPATGWLLASSSTAHSDGERLIQKWAYRFDEAGNLRYRSRADALFGVPSEESFTYDALNRLETSRVKVGTDPEVGESYGYDGLGNLTSKGGKTYTYGGCGAGPHAVCTVGGGAPFAYDANGNLTAGDGRRLTYNSRNKAAEIERIGEDGTGSVVDFMYGADGDRVVQNVAPLSSPDGVAARTVYVGMGATGKSLYERTTRGASVEHVHFLYAAGAHGGNAFALRTVTAGAPVATRYYHFDHLGSVTAMSDERGRIADITGPDAKVFNYDPWGARREPTGRPLAPGAKLNPQLGHREFTGHEVIPDVGLINMNGRVYDPILGRFLSPDPNVQFVANLQSYNRYSYVLNNPLRYSDPTGYFISGNFDMLVNFGLAVAGAAICGTTAVGCSLAFMFASTAYNLLSAEYGGAARDQVFLSTAFGMALAPVGGAVGEGIAGRSTIAGAMISGAVSGTIAGAITATIYGQGIGESALLAASQAATMAALTWAIARSSPVTVADRRESLGGGGTHEAKIVVVERKIAGARHRNDTLIVYGDPGPMTVVDASGQPVPGGDITWHLDEDNRTSYESALRRAVKSALKLDAAAVVPVSNPEEFSAAVKSGGYRNVVYIGHATSYTNDPTGYLLAGGEPISGSEVASAVRSTSVRNVYLLGCDPSNVVAEARPLAPHTQFHSRKDLLNLYVDFNESSMQVTKVSLQTKH